MFELSGSAKPNSDDPRWLISNRWLSTECGSTRFYYKSIFTLNDWPITWNIIRWSSKFNIKIIKKLWLFVDKWLIIIVETGQIYNYLLINLKQAGMPVTNHQLRTTRTTHDKKMNVIQWIQKHHHIVYLYARFKTFLLGHPLSLETILSAMTTVKAMSGPSWK